MKTLPTRLKARKGKGMGMEMVMTFTLAGYQIKAALSISNLKREEGETGREDWSQAVGSLKRSG